MRRTLGILALAATTLVACFDSYSRALASLESSEASPKYDVSFWTSIRTDEPAQWKKAVDRCVELDLDFPTPGCRMIGKVERRAFIEEVKNNPREHKPISIVPP